MSFCLTGNRLRLLTLDIGAEHDNVALGFLKFFFFLSSIVTPTKNLSVPLSRPSYRQPILETKTLRLQPGLSLTELESSTKSCLRVYA